MVRIANITDSMKVNNTKHVRNYGHMPGNQDKGIKRLQYCAPEALSV
jgi:hypothetical protein